MGTVCIHDKFHTSALKVRVDVLIMNHLTEQIDILSPVFFEGTVTDFNSILNTVAKTKMTSDEESNRTEVE